MQSKYEINYNKTADFIRKSAALYRIFKIIYKYIPYGTMVAYGCLILWCAFIGGDWNQTAKVILVPLTGFIVVSLMRKIFNFERPYTKYNIQPLIVKEKPGESFPSRHTFSIGIIALAFLYVNIPLGTVMLLLTVILAISRVIAGVHFIRDVVGAVIMAVVWGTIGFVLIGECMITQNISHTELLKISDSIIAEYHEEKIQLNEIITNSDYSFAVLDESTVLIQTEVIFQSVRGYVVSYSETPIESIKLPDTFGYDNDIIYLTPVEGYNNIYKYSAGL